jgi:L-threonylcarbamoyladenylate synthase
VIEHIPDLRAARALATEWPDSAQRLADAFWPGPLTMVLPKRDIVPDITTAGLGAVALRVPAHPVALALLRAFGKPIAAPSANRFTQVSPTTAQHVVRSLGDRIGCVLDGGPCDVGIESTVIDLAGTVPTILRPGMISRGQIEQVLQRPVDVVSKHVAAADVDIPGQRAPGMAERHYAPNADVWLFDSAQSDEISAALAARRRTRPAPPSWPCCCMPSCRSRRPMWSSACRTIRSATRARCTRTARRRHARRPTRSHRAPAGRRRLGGVRDSSRAAR